MNSQARTQLIKMLIYILVPVIIAIIVLGGFLIYLHFKEKRKRSPKVTDNANTNLSTNEQNKQSIFKISYTLKLKASIVFFIEFTALS